MHRIKFALPLLLAGAMPLAAQTDRATLTGIISDSTGARISNATVLLKSESTGVEHRTLTTNDGIYTLSALPVGAYEAEISAPGFELIKIQEVELHVGQTLTEDLKMNPTSVSQSVDVVSAGAGFDKSDARIGTVVQSSQIQEVPLNGRDWTGLMTLTPGVIDSGSGAQSTMRFAGMSDEDNVYHLDGVDQSGINHSYEKVNIRLQPSTEAIAEFRASSAVYSADQGGAPGGQMELVSRSGGEQFHGSMWEFLRNNMFDAAPWNATSLPALHLNDFGANIGGPVWKQKKMFFFANWESIRQNINQPINGYVPSAALRAQIIAMLPALAPVVNLYPVGTKTTSTAGIMQWFGNGMNTQQEDSGLARFDYQIDPKTALSVRYSTDHFFNSAPFSTANGYLNDTGWTSLTTPNILVDLQHTFTPRILNDFKFGFNRSVWDQAQTTALPVALEVGGLSAFSSPTGNNRFDNSFNTVDDATFVTGKHTIKAGVYVRRIQENKSSPDSPNQTLSYTSIADFTNNLIDTDTYMGTVPMTGQRMTEEFGYILDEYQMKPNITWNIGLRYEYYGVDHEVEGRGIVVDPLDAQACPNAVCPAGTTWYNPNLTDFEPRISVTWSPDVTKGKTVVRSGFGIYDGNGQFGNLGQEVSNIASAYYTLYQSNYPGLSYPAPVIVNSGAGIQSYAASPRNRKDLNVYEYTLSVQQQVAKNSIATVTYIGNNTDHAFSDWTLNGINPATGKRPFTNLSTLDYRGTFNHASYNALELGFQRNMTNGLLVSANYQWSHSIDDGGVGGGEADVPQNLACLSCERSSSDTDMRSYFTASTIWKLPVGRNHTFLSNVSPWVNSLIGDWQLSAIASARSGLPVNVTITRPTTDLPDGLNKDQRPNRVAGVSLYPANKTTGEWFNPAAFSAPAVGTWGNAGRNLLRAPGIWQIDPALNKRFPIREKMAVDFRASSTGRSMELRVAHGAPAELPPRRTQRAARL
jgi:hypothetical protein